MPRHHLFFSFGLDALSHAIPKKTSKVHVPASLPVKLQARPLNPEDLEPHQQAIRRQCCIHIGKLASKTHVKTM